MILNANNAKNLHQDLITATYLNEDNIKNMYKMMMLLKQQLINYPKKYNTKHRYVTYNVYADKNNQINGLYDLIFMNMFDKPLVSVNNLLHISKSRSKIFKACKDTTENKSIEDVKTNCIFFPIICVDLTMKPNESNIFLTTFDFSSENKYTQSSVVCLDEGFEEYIGNHIVNITLK